MAPQAESRGGKARAPQTEEPELLFFFLQGMSLINDLRQARINRTVPHMGLEMIGLEPIRG